jgi:hypothetical protein
MITHEYWFFSRDEVNKVYFVLNDGLDENMIAWRGLYLAEEE